MYAQQYLQPKLLRRRYGGVSQALRNSTVTSLVVIRMPNN